MKKLLLTGSVAVALAASSQAATVQLNIDDFVTANTVTGDQISGSSTFVVGVTEAGASFDVTITVTGVQVNGGSNLRVGELSGDDYILMRSSGTSTQNTSVTFTVSSSVQTAGAAGSTLIFDGITNYLSGVSVIYLGS